MISAGKLRHRIRLELETEGRDTFGAVIPTWSTFAECWAAVEPLRGREYFAAQQVNAEVTHTIRLRYLPGVTPQMRVRFGARVFKLASVINLEERNRELQLMAVEVV